MTSLLIVYSYHHSNTRRVAEVIAQVLEASIMTPEEAASEDLRTYDLVGFGSGIYGAKHHESFFDLVDGIPQSPGARAFIFSTFGAPKLLVTPTFIKQNHNAIREKLLSKGFTIVGEFGCAGWNTNSFLRFSRGLNRGRPNAEDLDLARAFARGLIDDRKERS
jgi:flavodoxin